MIIEFYLTSSGRSPVTDFIEDFPLIDQKILLAVLSGIKDNGLEAKGCNFKQLEGKIWEVKIKSYSGGYRILYTMRSRNNLFILHAFSKKTQKTPLRDLKIARKRYKEIL